MTAELSTITRPLGPGRGSPPARPWRSTRVCVSGGDARGCGRANGASNLLGEARWAGRRVTRSGSGASRRRSWSTATALGLGSRHPIEPGRVRTHSSHATYGFTHPTGSSATCAQEARPSRRLEGQGVRCGMRIGELATRGRIPPKTIRYWEQLGPLPHRPGHRPATVTTSPTPQPGWALSAPPSRSGCRLARSTRSSRSATAASCPAPTWPRSSTAMRPSWPGGSPRWKPCAATLSGWPARPEPCRGTASSGPTAATSSRAACLRPPQARRPGGAAGEHRCAPPTIQALTPHHNGAPRTGSCSAPWPT
jgi:hypothetical protein